MTDPEDLEALRVYIAAHVGVSKLRALQTVDHEHPLTNAMKIEFISDTLDHIERRAMESLGFVKRRRK